MSSLVHILDFIIDMSRVWAWPATGMVVAYFAIEVRR